MGRVAEPMQGIPRAPRRDAEPHSATSEDPVWQSWSSAMIRCP